MAAENTTPKSYRDFLRPGVGKPFNLADQEFDPANLAARRSHMIAYMKHMKPVVDSFVDREHRWAEEALCRSLERAGIAEVSIPYFEFMVDRHWWEMWCKN